ncbi:leucine-rich repeat domain-containing protein [Paenibacillus spongiae]|uniref:Leucine-rich repeat domain-containing protein n=1 Tax=Paenibacillus spongiae TaxID=2909671 RepID=A0ABY5S280_9BACL|nr:leucine-rich repeat domain-containing protein [Paenibacillus spongiae]UVI27769.1 hypothetical protein L1F29_20140 [Paenibacillus spongiae]
MNNGIIEAEVRKQLGKETGELTDSDLLSITHLKLNNRELEEIGDLAKFHNLVDLELQDNWLTDLSPLRSLVRLERLFVSNDPFLPEDMKPARKNTFSGLEFITGLVNLRDISFVDCGISDISPLHALHNLENAWLYVSEISDLSPLRGLKKLHKVYFYHSKLREISVFKDLPHIKGIAINANEVSDLTPIKDCVEMTYLDAHTNRIRDIAPLAKLTNLIYLTLAENDISDISVLESMQGLRHLTLSSNPNLKDVNVVKQLKSLRHLELIDLDLSDDVIADLKAAMPECHFMLSYD